MCDKPKAAILTSPPPHGNPKGTISAHSNDTIGSWTGASKWWLAQRAWFSQSNHVLGLVFFARLVCGPWHWMQTPCMPGKQAATKLCPTRLPWVGVSLNHPGCSLPHLVAQADFELVSSTSQAALHQSRWSLIFLQPLVPSLFRKPNALPAVLGHPAYL